MICMTTAKKKKKQKTAAQLAEACAVSLQLLVRLKASDANGYCRCVTCGTVKHYKEMQGGHFIERGRSATKLLEENIHPQCRPCNAFGMQGSLTVLEYNQHMEDMYGKKFVEDLRVLARTTHKWNRAEIEIRHGEIKKEIAEHQKRVCG